MTPRERLYVGDLVIAQGYSRPAESAYDLFIGRFDRFSGLFTLGTYGIVTAVETAHYGSTAIEVISPVARGWTGEQLWKRA